MKKFVAVGILAAMTITGASASQSLDVVAKAPGSVFTPKGFDSDDNAQVVLSGGLSNFCFHEAPATFHLDAAARKVYVDNRVYDFDHCQGAMMFIPYAQVLNLGLMSPGDYEIWVSDGKGGYEKRADLPVARAAITPFSPDDTRYAPVSEIQYVPAPEAAADPSLVIRGSMSDSCLKLGPVSVREVEGNVVQVEPTARWVTSHRCTGGAFPFTETVPLTGFPGQGEVLIHVRAMGGQALNRVITFLDRLPAGS